MDGCIFVKCYLILVYMHPLLACGGGGGGGGSRLGVTPRVINKRYRGWGGVMSFGGWDGEVLQNQTSPDFRFQEVDISDPN